MDALGTHDGGMRRTLGRVRARVRTAIGSPTADGVLGRLRWELAVGPHRRPLAARRVAPELAGHVAALEHDGISIGGPELISADAVAALRDRWETWADAHPAVIAATRSRAGEPHEAKTFLVRLSEHQSAPLSPEDPLVAPLLAPELLSIVEAHLGAVPQLLYVDIWLNVPTGRPPIRSQHWHRDPEDRRIVKVFTYLDEVGDDQGPFGYVPGTHRRGRVKGDPTWFTEPGRGARRATDEAVAEIVAPDRWRSVTGAAGTVVLADTTGLHRGGHARAGDRLLHTAMFTTRASTYIPTRG